MFEHLANSFQGINDTLFFGLNITDFSFVIGLVLWGLGLLIPITRIDKSDITTAAMHILYFTSSGIILCYAIPQKFHTDFSPKHYVLGIGAMVLICLSRWLTAKKYSYAHIKSEENSNGN